MADHHAVSIANLDIMNDDEINKMSPAKKTDRESYVHGKLSILKFGK
jgi:hypothetical protein